jgi:hypothetical protein
MIPGLTPDYPLISGYYFHGIGAGSAPPAST